MIKEGWCHSLALLLNAVFAPTHRLRYNALRLRRVDRLGYVGVHAGFQAFLFVFHEGIGRQGNDGNRPDIRES